MKLKFQTYKRFALLKKEVVLLLCAACLLFSSYGQEPPPNFKLILTDGSMDGESILSRYDFQGFMYKAPRLKRDHKVPAPFAVEMTRVTHDGFVRVTMFGEDYLRTPATGDLIQLRVMDKESGEQMDIVIRVSYSVKYSEEVTFDHWGFESGMFFMDMCSSDHEYAIPAGKPFATKIDITSLDQHRVPMKKLKKIITKYKCVVNNKS